MGTFLSLAERLEAKAKKIEDDVNKKVQAVALGIITDLAYVTPVDTSTALSNWQISFDVAPSPIPLPPHFPGDFGDTARQSAQETIALAKRELSLRTPGREVYISNVAPYIVRLNGGSSRQEPAGFVERAILIGRNIARK